MPHAILKYLKPLIAPLALLGFFLLMGFVWKLLHLPPEEELIPIIKSFFDRYGIMVVLIAAIVESAFIFGVYVPGGLVIFLGVIFSIGDPLRAVFVVITVIIGFLIGFTFDFYIGKFGWYKLFLHFGFGKILERTKERIQNYSISVPWFFYHHPDLGSFFATACGMLNFTYQDFLMKSILPITVWCAFWGILAYSLGMTALHMMGYKVLFIVVGVWMLARIIEMVIKKRKSTIVKSV